MTFWLQFQPKGITNLFWFKDPASTSRKTIHWIILLGRVGWHKAFDKMGCHYDHNSNLKAPRIYFKWKIPHQPLAKQSTGLFCSAELDDIRYSAKWIFTQRKTDLKFPWGLLKFTLYFLVSFSEIKQLLQNVFCHLCVVCVYHRLYLNVVGSLDLESFDLYRFFVLYEVFQRLLQVDLFWFL